MSDGESTDTRLALLEARTAQMWEWINGGPSTKYEDSARGKLHELMQENSTADKLTEALRMVKEERSQRWAGWQKFLVLATAVATAAAAWYAALGH